MDLGPVEERERCLRRRLGDSDRSQTTTNQTKGVDRIESKASLS